MARLVVDRRTFLKAAGSAAVGVAAAQRALASARPAPRQVTLPTQLADDPIAVQADALGYDQEAIFRFVADEVHYEPYPGILRGPRATLAGRAGNAADKALLLAALLRASLIEARYVEGILDDATAARLAGVTVDPDAARARAVAAATTGATAVPSGEPTAPEVQAIIERMPEIDASVTAWASATVDASVRTITDALAGAGVVLPAGSAALPELERTRHLWVQVPFGTDWLDLDPTVGGSESGRTVATATAEPNVGLPDDLRHRIDITVTGERIVGGGFQQEVLLEHSLFADESTDVAIVLGHAKPEGLVSLGVALGQLLTGGVRYQPILHVGETAFIGVSGLVVSGGEGGVFDTGESSAREGEATAEWLEVNITSPGGRVTTARRTLFDRIGEADRLAGSVDPATIPPAELVDVAADARDEFLPLRSVHFLSVATGATRRPLVDDTTADDARTMAALGLPAPMYHVARDATNVVLALKRGAAVHLDAPNVVMHSYTPASQVDGSVAVSESIDLLHRSFASRPAEGVAVRVPPGVLAGVTSHVAERLRMGEGLPVDLAIGPPSVSAGAILERASLDGTGLSVLRGPMPGDTGYPPEVVARLRDALAAGWVAIVPERAVAIGGAPRLGWWLVDPATGATVDMLDDGRGVTMVEWATVVVLVAIGTVVAYHCVSSASRAAAWNAAWAELRSDAITLGAEVGPLPPSKGAC